MRKLTSQKVVVFMEHCNDMNCVKDIYIQNLGNFLIPSPVNFMVL